MKGKSKKISVKHEAAPVAKRRDWDEPFGALRREMERVFDEFDWPDFRLPRRWGRFGPPAGWRTLAAGVAVPAFDLVEHEGEYEVQGELPGMQPEEVEVKVTENMLIIKGEKSAEREETEGDYHLRERSHGSFQRAFSLPAGTDVEKVEAALKDGVLTVRLPKTAEAREKERHVEVKAG